MSTVLAQEAIAHGAVQKERELRWLLDYLDTYHPPPTRILEIGSWHGGTLWLWRQLAPTVVSIDINPVAFECPGVQIIQSDSRTAEVEGPFDLVFVDGDHSYEGAKSDWERFSPMTPLIAFHDIVPGHPDGREVHRLWAELKESHETVEFIDPLDQPVRDWETLTSVDGGIGVVVK